MVTKSPGTLVPLGAEIRRTAKAAAFHHEGGTVWIPLRSLVVRGSGYAAPQWAIDGSKKFQKGK